MNFGVGRPKIANAATRNPAMTIRLIFPAVPLWHVLTALKAANACRLNLTDAFATAFIAAIV